MANTRPENACEGCVHLHYDKCDTSECKYESKYGIIIDKYEKRWDLLQEESIEEKTGPEMKKYDNGKLRWDLLPIEPIEEIIRILMFGATKYEENNWKNGSSNKDINRTYAAAMRHLTAWKKGEECAEDSGLLHLSHAACDIIFLIHHSLTKKEMERNWD